MIAAEQPLSPLSEASEPAPPISQEAYWQAHISQWAQSELSQSAYCRREGLILHRWRYWRNKLRDSTADQPKLANELVPVKVIAQPIDHDLSITLANGIRISGVNTYTLPLLGTVLKQL